VLVACLALGALGAGAGLAFDGRSFGGFIARHAVCAVTHRCQADERQLAEAYGERTAARVRALAPNLVYERGERELPVDWRDCRRARCATAPNDPRLDAHVSDAGRRATAFTRVVRRDGRLYVSYWLYYPDSNTAVAGSDRLWERSWLLPRVRELVSGERGYPGFHLDDWEGAFVRVDPDGSTWLRASSHGGFQGCMWRDCHDRWARSSGWVRVSRGSHSGHVPYRREPVWIAPERQLAPRHVPARGRPRRIPVIPGRDLDERSSTGEGLRLIPLETLDRRGYVPRAPGVNPPWRKRAYSDPEAGGS
jgi:hypothetical protein